MMWVVRRAFCTSESEQCRKSIVEPPRTESPDIFPVVPDTDLVPDLTSSERAPLRCHEQAQSSLFSKLPAELRRIIFEFAFAQEDNDSDAAVDDDGGCQQDMFSCQPMARRSITLRTGLLRTCQRAYREAWSLVIENPQPPRQAPLNVFDINIWAKLFWFQHGGLAQNFSDKFDPSIVTLNIRQGDWYGWDTDAPLQIKKSWIVSHGYRLPASCTQLNIRFLTEERKRGQLENIVQDITAGSETASPWVFERSDSVKMVPVADETSPIYHYMSFTPLTPDQDDSEPSHYFAAFVSWEVSGD